MAVPSYDRLAQEDSPAGDASAHADFRSIPRPAVYYGEGPFDAPDSDEEETFLEKPQSPRLTEDAREMDDIDEELGLYVGGHRQRWSSIRWLVILLGCLVAFAALIGLSAALSYKGPVRVVRGTQPITMDHVFNGTFYPEKRSLAWIPEAGDGVYSIIENDWIVLVDLKNNSTRKLVHKDALKDKDGKPLTWSSWKLSADMKYVLVKTDHLKQWRHSSFGNYYVLELQTNKTRPLTTPEHPPTVSYAAWSPTGDSIAFVKSNDLYVLQTPSGADDPIRVTSTGNATLFHGVPDWVYEEEVFAADFALWWSPDSSKVAFLTSDETDVHSYVFPVYNPSSWNNMAIEPYTTDVRMRYPKPGYPNPRVSAHIFDVSRFLADRVFDVEAATLELDWGGRLPYNDSVIMEITWLDNVNLLIKEVSRNADRGSVVLFDLSLSTSTGQVVRSLGKNGEEGDDGWIEASQTVHPLPSSLLQNGTSGYLDIVPMKDGFNHIALFSPADSSTPRFLTTGEWEVTGGIAAVDPDRRLVYYQAATPASTQRHIYSIPLPSLDGLTPQSDMEIAPPTALSETDSAGYYSASFSPRGAFYLLSYEGPNIPWQQVVYAGEPEKSFILTNNTALNATWSGFQMPIVQYSTIINDGYELNAVEIRPPHMDDSGRTKYPVLFRVYGGPNSQLVSQKFSIDWHYYLACSLQYIIVVVDGRGTGLKGRKLRNPVKSNLGYWETKDQIEAARIWASKDYVDPRRIGIWGWSYGGYMSLKVVEADAGIHTLAMSVAPPTDWRMYDTIYTERYMNLPQLNEEGYANSSVSNVTAFDKVDFALAHGSADDNVHFANTAHLLDLFTAAQIRKYRFRMFTDSDHSISKRGAYRELHEYLTTFLLEKWGKGGRRRGW